MHLTKFWRDILQSCAARSVLHCATVEKKASGRSKGGKGPHLCLYHPAHTALGDLQAQMNTTQPPLAEEQQFLLLIRQKGGRQVDKQVESSRYSEGMQSPPVCVPLGTARGWHAGRREGVEGDYYYLTKYKLNLWILQSGLWSWGAKRDLRAKREAAESAHCLRQENGSFISNICTGFCGVMEKNWDGTQGRTNHICLPSSHPACPTAPEVLSSHPSSDQRKFCYMVGCETQHPNPLQMQKVQLTSNVKLSKIIGTFSKANPNQAPLSLVQSSSMLRESDIHWQSGHLYMSTEESIKTHCWERAKHRLWMVINHRDSLQPEILTLDVTNSKHRDLLHSSVPKHRANPCHLPWSRERQYKHHYFCLFPSLGLLSTWENSLDGKLSSLADEDFFLLSHGFSEEAFQPSCQYPWPTLGPAIMLAFSPTKSCFFSFFKATTSSSSRTCSTNVSSPYICLRNYHSLYFHLLMGDNHFRLIVQNLHIKTGDSLPLLYWYVTDLVKKGCSQYLHQPKMPPFFMAVTQTHGTGYLWRDLKDSRAPTSLPWDFSISSRINKLYLKDAQAKRDSRSPQGIVLFLRH